MSVSNKLTISTTLLAICALTACTSGPKYPAENSSAPEQSQKTPTQDANKTAATNTAADSDAAAHVAALDDVSVEFKLEDGSTAFKILHSKNSGELLDATGKAMLTFAENPTKEKIARVQDNTGKLVCWVKVPPIGDHIKIEDASNKLIYKLNIEKDGDYKLKDGAGQTLYKLKAESYGLKIKTGDDADGVYKIKLKDGKSSLKNADGKTVIYTKADMPTIVLACFGMDKLPKDLQFALAYTLLFMRL